MRDGLGIGIAGWASNLRRTVGKGVWTQALAARERPVSCPQSHTDV